MLSLSSPYTYSIARKFIILYFCLTKIYIFFVLGNTNIVAKTMTMLDLSDTIDILNNDLKSLGCYCLQKIIFRE
ncbi:hypothetical protein Osc7112_1258 [Oscillatoria nigro-viridis PCC 7112]|uniref:Uncharacterized protein n=1 Tax=Phormidium nigroviride PCC 7112 TaxID=179408 RepID=K9VCZ1_9CYAN|nr:hypothetical protein Osc7112_1258 [Oscillatoria nigro-viridis PCC 7112]